MQAKTSLNSPRLTLSHKGGTSNKTPGFSNVLATGLPEVIKSANPGVNLRTSKRTSKTHPTCKFHGNIQLLANKLSVIISLMESGDHLIPIQDEEFIRFIRKHVFNFGSFVYYQGVVPRYSFNEDKANFVMGRAASLNQAVLSHRRDQGLSDLATDFMLFQDPLILAIEEASIVVRQAEQEFWAFRRSIEFVGELDAAHMADEKRKRDAIANGKSFDELSRLVLGMMNSSLAMGNFLNCVSTWLFDLCRYLHVVNGFEIEEYVAEQTY